MAVPVPRPPGTRPGGPAPWARLSLAARKGLSVAKLRSGLESAGQLGAHPSIETWTGEPASVLVRAWESQAAIPSAVLAAVFQEEGELRVLLTRRAAGLRSHRGQISFPGGRIEPGEDIWDAAVREAAEEVSLDPSSPKPLGWLHPVVTRSSRSLILPVVALLESRPDLIANPTEVARAFDVSFTELAADGVFHEERWRIPTLTGTAEHSDYPVFFFDVADETVWGATARMLCELLRLALGLGYEPPGGRHDAEVSVPRFVD